MMSELPIQPWRGQGTWIVGEVRGGRCWVECCVCGEVKPYYDDWDTDHEYGEEDDDQVVACHGHRNPVCSHSCYLITQTPPEIAVERGL